MLLEYNKKSSEPLKVYSSNILNFHYTLSDKLYFKEQFELNPFKEENLDLDLHDMPVHIPEAKEEIELITSGKFRDLEYNKEGEIETMIPGTNYPYLFIPHDRWWEYENFQKFPDYPTWYQFKFTEWHKHIIMAKYLTVTYDPLWSIENEPYYSLCMFYYSTTLKYYRPWKTSEHSGVLYDGSRILVYLILAVGFFGYYQYHHIVTRTRLNHVMINEDFWLKHYEYVRLKHNQSSPNAIFIRDELLKEFKSPLNFFIIGPDGVEDLVNTYKHKSKMNKEDYYKMIKV